MPAARLDSILLSVIANRLDSITKEMGQTMLRTSRSPIFSEARDFVTAVYDRDLCLVAQTAYILVLLAATPWAVRAIAETYADDTYEGDLHCLVGAAGVGERNLAALVRRYGAATVERAVKALLDASERHMRAEIRAIPNGRYVAERGIDNDGIVHDRRVTIRVQVDMHDDTITFDYSGSDGQVPGYVNSPSANTDSATYLALFTVVDPNFLHNAGTMRPVSMVAPRGSVLNPVEPASTTACTVLTGETITEAGWLALSQAVPERAQAAWGRWCAPATTGMNPRTGRPFGEIGDGLIVDDHMSGNAEGAHVAIRAAGDGARRAGRDPAGLRYVAAIDAAIDDDRAAALDQVRPTAARNIANKLRLPDTLGVEHAEGRRGGHRKLSFRRRSDAGRTGMNGKAPLPLGEGLG